MPASAADAVVRARLDWDAMHRRYFPDYDRRWQLVIDRVRAHAPADCRVLDAGCGPGTLTARLGAAFPGASVVGVEADPMLIGLARAASGGERYLHATLGTPAGEAQCAGLGPYDAVVSSAFVHYFAPAELAELLRGHRRVLAPYGVLITAERFAPAVLRHRRRGGRPGPGPWRQWWTAARADPAVAALAGAAPAFAPPRTTPPPLRLRQFIAALRRAGYRQVSVAAAGGGSLVVTAHRGPLTRRARPSRRRWWCRRRVRS
ncbi:MAG: class I SAM-dependent methyltransferase [Micropruina sp.]|uniref:class I SAM-dependent methyltransferase n=1 Tax=Micropruina sp. TaxID=2737536 RepID=UPI0039E575BE